MATVKNAIEKNICKICSSMSIPPPCKGHIKGGGGDGNQEKSTDKKSDNDAPKTSPSFKKIEHIANDWELLLKLSDSIIDFKTKLLAIECDRLRGSLKIGGNTGLSKEEQEMLRGYLELVKAAFEDFREKLIERGVAVTNFTATLQDNVLTINMPNPKLFAEFIERLTGNNLLPSPQGKHPVAAEEPYMFHPTPLSTRPKPKGWQDE
jgi:hypothetical protein